MKEEVEMEQFTLEIALDFVNQRVLANTKEDLSQLEKTIFRGAWNGLTYPDIAEKNNYSTDYLNNYAGRKFWRKITKATGIELRMKLFKAPLYEYWVNISSNSSPSRLPESGLSENHEVVERCSRILLMPGALLKIKSPKKRGKTILALNVLKNLHDTQGYRTVCLSLDFADDSDYRDITYFLKWFCLSICNKLNIPNQLADYWNNDNLTPKVICTNFLEELILAADNRPLVLCVDRLDRVFLYPEIAREFFGLLRGWYEQARSHDGEIREKLRIAILYCTENYGDINPNESPFNIGRIVMPSGLTTKETSLLAIRYGVNWPSEDANIQKLVDYVGGHPYLIDAMLDNFKDCYRTLDEQLRLESKPTSDGIYSTFLKNLWEEVAKDPNLIKELQRILDAENTVDIPKDSIKLVDRLIDIGLIIRTEENLVMPYCQLFRKYFRAMIK
jgi:AAA-like domain